MKRDRSSDGYRHTPGNGPRIRADVVDVYVFRREAKRPRSRTPGVQLLQLLRAKEPLKGTWHPVMGHIEPGETAVQAMFRELHEELGLHQSDPALRGLWALEQVHPFFIAAIDCIVLSPRFAAEVSPDWTPRLNREHAEFRWVPLQDAQSRFTWPGQLATIREIKEHILPPKSLAREHLSVLKRSAHRGR